VTAHWSGWKRYMLRIGAMNAVFGVLMVVWFRNMATYARNDGIKASPFFFAQCLWFLFGKPGLSRRGLGTFLR
jgi:predicted metal-dependent hydrolase